MKTRGGKTRAGVLKITTATPGVDVPNQEHEPEDPGEMEIESVVVLPDIPYLPRPRKRPYSNVHKGKIYPLSQPFITFVKLFSIKWQAVWFF
jgi:hypothetical protein